MRAGIAHDRSVPCIDAGTDWSEIVQQRVRGERVCSLCAHLYDHCLDGCESCAREYTIEARANAQRDARRRAREHAERVRSCDDALRAELGARHALGSFLGACGIEAKGKGWHVVLRIGSQSVDANGNDLPAVSGRLARQLASAIEVELRATLARTLAEERQRALPGLEGVNDDE